MQAIILAAGMGKRLGEYTKNNTKCMVPVNGTPLIDRVLRQLSGLNLKRVVIVVGYEGQKLMDYLGDNYQGLKIEYVNNPIFDKTNNIYSLALAKEKLQEDDTILIESDLVFSDRLFSMIIECPYPNVALVAKYESWMDGTMVRIDDNQNIVHFVPKQAFKYSEIDSYYKTVNIYKFSKEFSIHKYVPFLEAYSKALGNNEYYEQVLRVITMIDQAEMKALPIGDEKWYEIDDVQDLDIAETIFADDNDVVRKYSMRYGGYWRFPQLLDFCYLVNPYFPPKKMFDELQSSFTTLLTQYPSGMYVNSLLAGKYFNVKQKYIVVGNGAAELIRSLMEDDGNKIGVIYPTFEEYPNRCKGQIISFIPSNADLTYNVDDIKEFFSDKGISSLLLINPDNPSGNYICVEDVLRLADWAKQKNILLIVDESFVDFTNNYKNNSLLHNEILETYENMAVVKSISKSYGVPGLRLGVIASVNSSLLERIKRDVSIWNINSFAEYYMQIFGKYSNDYVKACEQFLRERERFQTSLSKVPFIRVIPSQANFFLCELIGNLTAHELTFLLLKKYNIFIKDCTTKKGISQRQYVRIAIRDEQDNDKLVKALLEIADNRM